MSYNSSLHLRLHPQPQRHAWKGLSTSFRLFGHGFLIVIADTIHGVQRGTYRIFYTILHIGSVFLDVVNGDGHFRRSLALLAKRGGNDNVQRKLSILLLFISRARDATDFCLPNILRGISWIAFLLL